MSADDDGADRCAVGVRLLQEGQYAEAVAQLSKAVFLAPDEPQPYVSRAEAYARLGDLRSAVANYRKALAVMESDAAAQDVRLRLAQVLDALALLAFRQHNGPAAVALANESLAESPHPLTRLHLAIFHIAAADYGPAEAILRDLAAHHADVAEPQASTLLARLVITTRRDFAAAKSLVDAMRAAFPHSPHVANAQDFVSDTYRRFREAAAASLSVKDVTLCIAAYPDDGELYRLRATAHMAACTYTDAVTDIFECINRSPDNAAARAMMGTVLAAIGDDLAAGEDYGAAVHYYTESTKWAALPAVLLARGDCHVVLGAHEAAERDFKAVVADDPLHDGARGRLGSLYDRWGSVFYNDAKYERAEAAFTTAIDCHDQSPAFFFHRALARGMLGKGPLMVRDLLSCRDLGTDDPQMVGMIQHFCTESSEAERHLMQAKTDEMLALQQEIGEAARTADIHRRRARREARPQEDDCRLGTLRVGNKTDLDGGVLTPANIRHFVRNMHLSRSTGVRVTIDPVSGTRKINGAEAATVEQEERRKPRWAASQRKPQSRLSRVTVTEATPIPAAYKQPPPQPHVPQSMDPVRYGRRNDKMHDELVVNPASAGRRAPLASRSARPLPPMPPGTHMPANNFISAHGLQ